MQLVLEFAHTYKFRKFYKDNRLFYDSLLVAYKQIYPKDNLYNSILKWSAIENKK